MKTYPLVTVIVPARNEAGDIARAIEAIGRQDYPVNRMEVLVVDGDSTDDSPAVAQRALSRFAFDHAEVLHNDARTTPSNLNHGLAKARGEIVCRVDARTLIEPHYVRTCVGVLLERPDVAVVGGAQHAVARGQHPRALGVARALNNRWATGFSRYRRATTSGASDTVYLGAFRTDDLREAGGWDERLGTNQDFDLNRRLASVGLVWFDGSLRSGYLPRETYRHLWRQYVRFGEAKVAYWRMTGDRPQPRQWFLILAPPTIGAVTMAWAATGGWKRIRRVSIVAGGALAAIEIRGAEEPQDGPAAHAAGALAIVTIGGGWLVGVLRGALRPARP